MPTVTLYDQMKKKLGELKLSDEVFSVPFKSHLIYETVVAQQANQRQGTASTKTRAEVRGGGIKPYRQKGTGRARQGSTRSPLLVGGGTTFGPKPRSYAYKLPKKVLKEALKTAFSRLCKENKLFIIKDLQFSEIKTKNVIKVLGRFSLEKGLIIDGDNMNLMKSVRNLRNFKYLHPHGINMVDLLKYQNIVATEKAMMEIQNRLLS
ncbi:MAG: 50S ribosomal protein L4 [Deltaproteobacteria bacterium]|nr:50S ribosomal protein L4 [Deltaproteobacteria bacterium]